MSSTVDHPGPIRRIVTTVDGHGVGKVMIDGPVRRTEAGDRGSIQALFGVAWQTDSSPADSQAEGDGAELPTGELTNPNGSIIRFVDSPPHHSSPMHRTDSVDYGILLSGKLVLELDDGSMTDLNPGDVVVQRSTDHAWHNKSDEWARMVFVLLPAKPVVVGGKILEIKSIH